MKMVTDDKIKEVLMEMYWKGVEDSQNNLSSISFSPHTKANITSIQPKAAQSVIEKMNNILEEISKC